MPKTGRNLAMGEHFWRDPAPKQPADQCRDIEDAPRKSVGGFTVHNAEGWRVFFAFLINWVAPIPITGLFGKFSGTLLLLFYIGNSVVYLAMNEGQDIGKQIMGIRLTYVTQRYDEFYAHWCEVTPQRAAVRLVCHCTIDLMLFPYAVLIRPWLRYDHRTYADSITKCTVVRDRRLVVESIEEMKEARRKAERPWN